MGFEAVFRSFLLFFAVWVLFFRSFFTVFRSFSQFWIHVSQFFVLLIWPDTTLTIFANFEKTVSRDSDAWIVFLAKNSSGYVRSNLKKSIPGPSSDLVRNYQNFILSFHKNFELRASSPASTCVDLSFVNDCQHLACRLDNT